MSWGCLANIVLLFINSLKQIRLSLIVPLASCKTFFSIGSKGLHGSTQSQRPLTWPGTCMGSHQRYIISLIWVSSRSIPMGPIPALRVSIERSNLSAWMKFVSFLQMEDGLNHSQAQVGRLLTDQTRSTFRKGFGCKLPRKRRVHFSLGFSNFWFCVGLGPSFQMIGG